MSATVADVLGGNSRWACAESDAVEFLASLPDDSVDLLFTSPPYELARTYGLGERMVGGQAWVDWMVCVVRAAAPKVKGLIAVNCEGQTRDYSYSGVPFLLFADLLRAGFNMRKPPVFHRVGIPGSGGPDWLRNDYEPIVCVTRPGRLPWSDNTACGHPPKWAPGGEMSNRLSNGTRVNQWGKTGKDTATAVDDGGVIRSKGKRPSHQVLTKYRRTKQSPGREGEVEQYTPPAVANPGNVVSRTYTADEVAELLGESSDVIHCNVGGGQMGHAIAHDNEAPFPVELAEFFIRSFCPPGGVVLDCFSGSGTTCHAAVENNRRFVGCDLRASQVELCSRRMRTITPSMFTDETVAGG